MSLYSPIPEIFSTASLAQSARVWDFYDKRNIPGLRVRVPRVASHFVTLLYIVYILVALNDLLENVLFIFFVVVILDHRKCIQ